MAGFRQLLLERRAVATLTRSLLAFLDALQGGAVGVECFMDTSASLLRWDELRLSLKITILLDLDKVRAQFVFYCVLYLLYAVLHQEELLEFGVGPRPLRRARRLLPHTPMAASCHLILLVAILVLHAHDPGNWRLLLRNGVLSHPFLLLHQVLVV